jgi:outer membrane protein OmpA-like peptidoglycan-associated protein
VFSLVALVVASVIGLGIFKGHRVMATPTGAPSASSQSAVTAATAGAALAASDAASVTVENGVVKFYFASGKADLAAGASEALADLVKGAQGGRKLVISGFHDDTGNAAQNAELAKQRAMAVQASLKASGVNESQIELKKPEQTAGAGSNAEARRVEVALQ